MSFWNIFLLKRQSSVDCGFNGALPFFGKEKRYERFFKEMSDFFAEQNHNGNCRKPEHLEGHKDIHCKASDVSGEEEKRYKHKSKNNANDFKKCRRKGRLSYNSAAVEKIGQCKKASVINCSSRCAFALFSKFGTFLLIFGRKKVKLAFRISENLAKFLCGDVRVTAVDNKAYASFCHNSKGAINFSVCVIA